MVTDKEIYNMAEPTMPDQPGSPTKAEVDALFRMYRGQPVPDKVQEAILLSTNTANRALVEQSLAEWNKTAGGEFPKKVKLELGRGLARINLINSIALGSVGLIDTSELRKLNLGVALQNEVAKNIHDLDL